MSSQISKNANLPIALTSGYDQKIQTSIPMPIKQLFADQNLIYFNPINDFKYSSGDNNQLFSTLPGLGGRFYSKAESSLSRDYNGFKRFYQEQSTSTSLHIDSYGGPKKWLAIYDRLGANTDSSVKVSLNLSSVEPFWLSNLNGIDFQISLISSSNKKIIGFVVSLTEDSNNAWSIICNTSQDGSVEISGMRLGCSIVYPYPAVDEFCLITLDFADTSTSGIYTSQIKSLVLKIIGSQVFAQVFTFVETGGEEYKFTASVISSTETVHLDNSWKLISSTGGDAFHKLMSGELYAGGQLSPLKCYYWKEV